MMTKLRIDKLGDPDAIEALLPEWEALDAALDPRTPFSSPAWIRLWWRHYRRRSLTTGDVFFFHTVRDDGGRLIAVAPLMITHKPAVGPLRMRILQFVGADPSITEVRGVVCRLEHHALVVRALIDHLWSLHGAWDLMLWRGIRDTALDPKAIAVPGRVQVFDALPCYVLDLPATWDILIAGVSSNMRKNVRKAYEFLERDGHRFVFRSRHRPEETPAALDRFVALHAMRGAATDMQSHPDRFSVPQHRAMLDDFAVEMAAQDRLRVLQLEIGGAVVASRVAFQLGDELYVYYSGFDLAWRKYSVMTTLMAETIKWAIANGMKRVNLSTGNDLSKLRWRPREVLLWNLLQIAPTARGRLALQAYTRAFKPETLEPTGTAE